STALRSDFRSRRHARLSAVDGCGRILGRQKRSRSLRSRDRAGKSGGGGESGGRDRGNGALLSAPGLQPRRGAENGGATGRATRATGPSYGTKRTGAVRTSLS